MSFEGGSMGRPERIAIIGAGLMGNGIAAVFAARGHAVALHDPVPAALEAAPARIRTVLADLGWEMAAVGRVALHPKLEDAVRDADFVTEAAPEKLPLKQEIFVRLAETTGPECLLASNTSVIPIGQIGANMKDASRVVGTHWWNPPYLIPLVEVVQAERTDPAWIPRCMELLQRVGKRAVHVKKDVPGFVGNRLQHALWREAIALVDAGVCDASTVDEVIKNSFGIRLPVLAPLENADLVGLDLTEDIHKVILPHLDRGERPGRILADKVRKGQLGMKTGRGFYDWTPEKADEVRARLIRHLRALLKP
jgi:3-hydroxybutyryl-CoA dehydrogenase